MRISLTQVAKQAGVSIATASRAINGTGPMTDKTRDKVLLMAQELGYVPDTRFRAMGQSRQQKSVKTHNLGLLIPKVNENEFVRSPYYARMLWTLQQVASEHDYHLTLSTIDSEQNDYLPTLVKDARVDGVMITMYENRQMLSRLKEMLPVVLINANSDMPGITSMSPDNHQTILRGFEYLRELGHKRICFFDIHDHSNRHHFERSKAFTQITRQFQAGFCQSRILKMRTKSLLQTCMDELTQWQQNGQMPTALLCASDHYALAFLEAAEQLQIKVPDTLSIIGIDDHNECQYSRPKLTSIRQPLEAMARASVNYLMQAIDGEQNNSPSIQYFDIDLIKRDSCASPKSD